MARIYPVYLLGRGVNVVPFLHRPHHVAAVLVRFVAQPLLLKAWLPSLNERTSQDPVGWSLSVEAFFYLLFPFIVIALARRSRRALEVVAALSLILFVALSLTITYALEPLAPSLSWWLSQALYFGPPLRLPEFTLGVALGLIYVHSRQHLPMPIESVKALAFWEGCIIALLAGAAVLQFVPALESAAASALIVPLFDVMILVLAQGREVIVRLLSSRACVWLGDASYAVYILHAPLWAWLAWIASTAFHQPPSLPILFPIYVASVLIAASLSSPFLERPARRAIRECWSTSPADARKGTREVSLTSPRGALRNTPHCLHACMVCISE